MGQEQDEFYIGERVVIDVVITVDGASPPNLVGTTVALTIQPPPDDSGVERAEATPPLTFSPATVGHASYVTQFAGWHEWRLQSTGVIEGARQGRFRVVDLNV